VAVALAENTEGVLIMAVLTVSSGVAPGTYAAKFMGTEIHPADPSKGYGAGIKWKFAIEGGPADGQLAGRITGSSPSTKNGCGKMLSGLLGRALQHGETIDPDQFVGKSYTVVVVTSPQGNGSRVEAVVPVAAY